MTYAIPALKPTGWCVLIVCFWAAPSAWAQVPEKLYPAGGIRAEQVRQGNIGSCYFHSAIAAIADTEPKLLEGLLAINKDGNYTVRFAEHSEEQVYADDISFARESGYDRSEGLWVAVLLRAYAQRVLRDAILRAIERSGWNDLMKQRSKELLVEHNSVLLAYDRAIREQVDAEGNISAKDLRSRLQEELQSLKLPDATSLALLEILSSKGVFDSVSAMLRENGELFGAYRAVGNGGLPERVFLAFTGSGRTLNNPSTAQVMLELSRARTAGYAVVAATGENTLEEIRSRGTTVPSDVAQWYVSSHAYTVLSFNGIAVTLRNPWGHHPDDSGGVFKVRINEFLTFFPEVSVQK